MIRVGTALIGVILIVLGLAGIVLPILPGWALVIGGLLVLSREFAWARRIVNKIREPLERRGILHRRSSPDVS